MRKITTIIIVFCLCLTVKAATLTVVQDSSALNPNFHYPEPTIVTVPVYSMLLDRTKTPTNTAIKSEN